MVLSLKFSFKMMIIMNKLATIIIVSAQVSMGRVVLVQDSKMAPSTIQKLKSAITGEQNDDSLITEVFYNTIYIILNDCGLKSWKAIGNCTILAHFCGTFVPFLRELFPDRN